jgi:carbonic anhydrase
MLDGQRIGLVDNWLRHVADVHDKHHESLEKLDAEQRVKTLCELNVIEQVLNVCQSTVLQDAWSRGQSVQVHAWIYSLHDGRIQTLNQGIEGADTVIGGYRRAVSTCWENINV